MESLQNGVVTYFQETPLISIRTKSQASSQSCRSIDADAWCKQVLIKENIDLQGERTHQTPQSGSVNDNDWQETHLWQMYIFCLTLTVECSIGHTSIS